MTINTTHKKRVLITIDNELLRILKSRNKKVSTTINDVLKIYLMNDFNMKLNEVLVANNRLWKSSRIFF